MAKNNINASSKLLDPMAPPYLKIPRTQFYSNAFPQSTSCYHILPPLISYSVHYQPRKSFPHPLPPPPLAQPWSSISKEKKYFSLTPVPPGPRIPKRGRRVNKVVRCGNYGGGTQEVKWRQKFAENKATVNMVGRKAVGFEGRKRWKNRSGDYHQILPIDTKTTSVMIKNIPNKYTRNLLILILDNHCKSENEKLKNIESVDEKKIISAYDFVYLPIDFRNRLNAGFAFVNFTYSKAALRFRDAFHGRRWNFFDCPKVAEISRARIQGKKALMNNCNVMDFTYGSDEDLPVLFEPARDGSGGVNSKMFTLGKFLH